MKRKYMKTLGVIMLSGMATTSEARVDQKNVYCVILAGGSGERLWPLSRQSKPKQLLSVGSQRSLLDQAIDRVSLLARPENIWISTTQQHASAIHDAVGSRVGNVVAEPGSRNTGPAILLSCCQIHAINPDAIVVFLPADAFIPEKDYHNFEEFLEHAIDFSAANDYITLLGVKPTYPATGYGYIEFDAHSFEQAPYKVMRFREKPSADVAQQYVESGTMLWNIGMFCGKASVFMAEYKSVAPDIFDGVTQFLQGVMPFDKVKSDSIDYAVMEKSEHIAVLPVDFGWCDVGNLEVFLTINEQYGVCDYNCITVNAKGNLINVPGKLVALIGVNDLCVVEKDGIVLITKRDQAERVREVVKQLKNGPRKEYL